MKATTSTSRSNAASDKPTARPTVFADDEIAATDVVDTMLVVCASGKEFSTSEGHTVSNALLKHRRFSSSSQSKSTMLVVMNYCCRRGVIA